MWSRLPPSILPLLVVLLCGAACASEPVDVDEVLIGYFGPGDPDDPLGGDLWRAAQLAVERANRDGGYRGKPFRLVPGWSKDPWGTGVAQVTRMVYDDKVWAIIGGIDGSSTHLAEQVVAKARLTLVSPVATDRSVSTANVPWAFSIAPGDHLLSAVLAAEIARRVGDGSFVSVSADDHDSHLFAMELDKRFAKLRIVPRFHFNCREGAEDTAEIIRRVIESKPAAAVVVAGPADSAKLVAALREKGFTGTIFGGPAMARSAFLRDCERSEDLVFPLPQEQDRVAPTLFRDGRCHFFRVFGKVSGLRSNKRTPRRCKPSCGCATRTRLAKESPRWPSFLRKSVRATHVDDAPPQTKRPVPFVDYAAAQTFDAVCLLVAAVREAGLERGAIRDAVEKLSPWTGVSGTVRWDRFGGNTRAVGLGTITDGRVVSYRPPRGPAGSTPR